VRDLVCVGGRGHGLGLFSVIVTSMSIYSYV